MVTNFKQMKKPLDYYKTQRNEEWRVELQKSMKPKERMALERTPMPEEEPDVRKHDLTMEIRKGFTKEMAEKEASRCMDCPNPTCIDGCPVGVNIPKFIKYIQKGDPVGAAKTIRESNVLPAICGRVCQQDFQCESNCFYHIKLKKPAVAIGCLQTYASDYANNNNADLLPEIAEPNGIKIAVIGAGPAGLAFSADLVKLGYDITIFEAMADLGGVLRYGIPNFRLPNSIIDKEIGYLKQVGVKFVTNFEVGKTKTIEQLREEEGFKAFFIGSGAGVCNFMNIPGEELNEVMSAGDFLMRVNKISEGETDVEIPEIKGKRVAVIGGGNTAMDAVRTVVRMGAVDPMIIYRRALEQVPACEEEVHEALEEGVIFNTLQNPIEYIQENGKLTGVKVQHMELGEPDDSGRRRPVPIEGKTEIIPLDIALVAIGVSPSPITANGLDLGKWGNIDVEDESKLSSIGDVYAGGDVVRGGATVILAMGDGKRAARAVHKRFQEG